jgi:hypothetical protein
VANEWFRLLIRILPTTPGFTPFVGLRAGAYLSVALYEALVPGMPGFQSLAGRLNELTAAPGPHDHAYHWPTAANSALATGMREFFRVTPPENLAAIDDLEASFRSMYAPRLPPGIAARSTARGRRVAGHIIAWARVDGGHDGHLTNFPTEYTPPVGPGLWVPTPPAFSDAYQPYWGTNRPMALNAVEDYDPGPPPPFSTDPDSAFYLGELEVYEVVNSLTDEQRAMVRHWATPLAHHASLALQAVEAQNADLATAAQAYARSAVAAYDGTIAVAHTKFRYNLLRPVTYIQEHIDPAWMSFIPSPAYPDHTAAHSVVTGALSQALYDQFGDFPFTDHTWDGVPLPPRSYSSWSEMAEETSISRLYGGIHTRWAIEDGLRQGRQVGRSVSAIFG